MHKNDQILFFIIKTLVDILISTAIFSLKNCDFYHFNCKYEMSGYHKMKFPNQIINELEKKYWYNHKNFKDLLRGEINFPLKLTLKSPITSSQILDHMSHIQDFKQAWQNFNNEFNLCKVEFQSKNFQKFGVVTLPYYLIIENRIGLISIFSKDKQAQLQNLQNSINKIICELNKDFEIDSQDFFNFLIDNLEIFENFSNDEIHQFLQLLPQLKFGMGNGLYLRNLPVIGVDSKFIETHFGLIELFLNKLYHNEIINQGGLMAWLNCQEKPNDWLLIKPLCEITKNKLANLPLLRLNSQTLIAYELPADNILIIENEQSCLMLNNIKNTMAIAGGGKNIGWLKAEWFKHKKVYYWGDIDLDGLFILSLARKYCPHIIPIMMDKKTVLNHQHLMVNDTGVINEVPSHLNGDEKALFLALKNGNFLGGRLEQERLEHSFVQMQLKQHLA